MTDNYFTKLYSIDVRDKTKQKNGLNYLSWAAAWAEVKKIHPDATYTVYENENGRYWFDDGRTAWVKTGVTINGIEHIERLPVMDFKNKSLAADSVTSMDANKALQRSLTKACGRHGVGLYIYEGEDMPEETKRQKTAEEAALAAAKKQVVDLSKAKIAEGVSKDEICAVIAKYTGGNKNPSSLATVEDCTNAQKDIEQLKK